MSLFPGEAEARAFADARALTTWVGIADEAFNAFEGQLGSFANRIRILTLLPSNLIGGVSIITPSVNNGRGRVNDWDVERADEGWRVDGRTEEKGGPQEGGSERDSFAAV